MGNGRPSLGRVGRDGRFRCFTVIALLACGCGPAPDLTGQWAMIVDRIEATVDGVPVECIVGGSAFVRGADGITLESGAPNVVLVQDGKRVTAIFRSVHLQCSGYRPDGGAILFSRRLTEADSLTGSLSWRRRISFEADTSCSGRSVSCRAWNLDFEAAVRGDSLEGSFSLTLVHARPSNRGGAGAEEIRIANAAWTGSANTSTRLAFQPSAIELELAPARIGQRVGHVLDDSMGTVAAFRRAFDSCEPHVLHGLMTHEILGGREGGCAVRSSFATDSAPSRELEGVFMLCEYDNTAPFASVFVERLTTPPADTAQGIGVCEGRFLAVMYGGSVDGGEEVSDVGESGVDTPALVASADTAGLATDLVVAQPVVARPAAVEPIQGALPNEPVVPPPAVEEAPEAAPDPPAAATGPAVIDLLIEAGMTRTQVVGVLGEPLYERTVDDRQYLFYTNDCLEECGTHDVVFLEGGVVVDAIVRGTGRRYLGPSTSLAGRRGVRAGA